MKQNTFDKNLFILFYDLYVTDKGQSKPTNITNTSVTLTSKPEAGLHPTTPPPVRLVKPVLDLDVTAVNNQINNPYRIAALPLGEAAVVNGGNQVLKINKKGLTIKKLYSCSCNLFNPIWGILSLGSNLYASHQNGTIVEIQPHSGHLLDVYNIADVGCIIHFGSLWSDPSKIPNTDILLLTDSGKGEVFSYNLTSKHKQVHLTKLHYPSSVSYGFYNNSTHYIICEHNQDMISIYNSSWDLVSSFGGNGSFDGYLHNPFAAIMSYNNTILVSDRDNHRISVFTTDGVFLYHLLTQFDGINEPTALSYYTPYMWVVNNKKIYRFRLHE